MGTIRSGSVHQVIEILNPIMEIYVIEGIKDADQFFSRKFSNIKGALISENNASTSSGSVSCTLASGTVKIWTNQASGTFTLTLYGK